jgi:hypothetical protein
LAKTLHVNAVDMAIVLDKLEKSRILRRQLRQTPLLAPNKQTANAARHAGDTAGNEASAALPPKVLWYELYHDLFSKPIEQWNNVYKAKQRNRRAMFRTVGAIAIGCLLYVAYDAAMNLTQYHFKLNEKRDALAAVELYRGKPGSWDFFGFTQYQSGVGYQAWQFEPDKFRIPHAVSQKPNLQIELVGNLPMEERILAYWQDGQAKQVLDLADQFLNEEDVNRTARFIRLLTFFRSQQVVPILAHKLERFNDTRLRKIIVRELAEIGGEQAEGTLIQYFSKPKLGSELQTEIIHALRHFKTTNSINFLVQLLELFLVINSIISMRSKLFLSSKALPESKTSIQSSCPGGFSSDASGSGKSSSRRWHVPPKRGFSPVAGYVSPVRRSISALGCFSISSAFCAAGLFWIWPHNPFPPLGTRGRAIDPLGGTILISGRIPFS